VEFVAEREFTMNDKGGENCMIFNDAATGPRGIPNCVCVEKILESKPTEYRFNSSGYRDDQNFGAKAPGTYRITVIGTSVAGGFRVPEEQTFATLLPAELSRRTGRRVEVYNEGLPWRSPELIAAHFEQDVVWTRPDLVLWVLTPEDIKRSTWVGTQETPPAEATNAQERLWRDVRLAFNVPTLSATMTELFSHARTATLLKEWLYRSPSRYANSFLLGNEEKTGYLESDPPVELENNLRKFAGSAGEMAAEARAAGIPVAVTLVPDRTEVAMISQMGAWPAGFDPYELDKELRPIVTSHGWTYLDIFEDYQTIADPQLGYFAVDGHPNGEGHALIARFLAEKLLEGGAPALRAPAVGQPTATPTGPQGSN
jgi:hypothetical protein